MIAAAANRRSAAKPSRKFDLARAVEAEHFRRQEGPFRPRLLIIKRLAFEPVLLKHLESLNIDHRSITMDRDFQKLDRERRLHRLALFAKRSTGDELLGLKIGKKVPLNGFGALAHAILSAPTPRHVLEITVKHMPIFQSHPPHAATLGNGKGRVYLVYKHPVYLRGFPNFVPDLFFASTLQTLRQLGGDLRGLRLELDYAPRDLHGYQQEIGIPVEFKSGRNRLSAPAETMNAPLPGKFFSESRAHLRLAENVLASVRLEEDLHNRVVDILALARDKTLRAPDVAGILNVSERSLRRKLQQAGINFTGLVAELRTELASAYLLEMPVRDVAELLGYHDPSTFRRAFRRWTGQTPIDYLRRLRGAAGRPVTSRNRTGSSIAARKA